MGTYILLLLRLDTVHNICVYHTCLNLQQIPATYCVWRTYIKIAYIYIIYNIYSCCYIIYVVSIDAIDYLSFYNSYYNILFTYPLNIQIFGIKCV